MPFIVVHVRVSQRRTNDTRALSFALIIYSPPWQQQQQQTLFLGFGFCFLLRVNMIINLLDDWNRRHGTFFVSVSSNPMDG
jgi:hypothetical protein